MRNLFEKWKTRIPKYSEVHKDLFTSLSQKYGAEGEKKVNLGKHFSTNYELYTYAFFLGLYYDEFSPIPEGKKLILATIFSIGVARQQYQHVRTLPTCKKISLLHF